MPTADGAPAPRPGPRDRVARLVVAQEYLGFIALGGDDDGHTRPDDLGDDVSQPRLGAGDVAHPEGSQDDRFGQRGQQGSETGCGDARGEVDDDDIVTFVRLRMRPPGPCLRGPCPLPGRAGDGQWHRVGGGEALEGP